MKSFDLSLNFDFFFSHVSEVGMHMCGRMQAPPQSLNVQGHITV